MLALESAHTYGYARLLQPFVLASQSEELEFTEDESRRFKLENVMLQRHFQHNLEDAKYDIGSTFEGCADVS
jgi:hypothetical protein